MTYIWSHQCGSLVCTLQVTSTTVVPAQLLMGYKLIAQAANIYNEQREEPTAKLQMNRLKFKTSGKFTYHFTGICGTYLEFGKEKPLKDHNMSQPGWIWSQ